MREFFIRIRQEVFAKIPSYIKKIIWKTIAEAILEAEKKFREEKSGKKKRGTVLKAINKLLKERGIGGWITRRLIIGYLRDVIDYGIFEINTRLGKDWVEKFDEANEILKEKKLVF